MCDRLPTQIMYFLINLSFLPYFTDAKEKKQFGKSGGN